jgi:hypothetical protein
VRLDLFSRVRLGAHALQQGTPALQEHNFAFVSNVSKPAPIVALQTTTSPLMLQGAGPGLVLPRQRIRQVRSR